MYFAMQTTCSRLRPETQQSGGARNLGSSCASNVTMTLGERVRTSVVAALIGAGVTWLAIPGRLETQERREDGPRIHIAPDMSNTPAPLQRLREPAAYDARALSSRRNLFAFEELQAPRARVPVAVHRPPEVAPVAVAVLETPAVASLLRSSSDIAFSERSVPRRHRLLHSPATGRS
jgi:hypothetical protein